MICIPDGDKVPMNLQCGIPTLYRGRQFRSRLEARWAAFFDLLGWRYEYEPFDLDGWIPDFLLIGANILVEIKPVIHYPEDVVSEIDGCSGADGREILILGCSIPIDTYPVVDGCDGIPIGWMRADPACWNQEEGMSRLWCYGLVQRFFDIDLPGFFDCKQNPQWGLFSSRDHILRADPGSVPDDDELHKLATNRFRPGLMELEFWGTGTKFDPDNGSLSIHTKILDLWATAGNWTQWRGKQSVVS